MFRSASHRNREKIAPTFGGRPWTRGEMAAGLANLLIAGAIVYLFHDRFWWPPDDGAYAYIADRINKGDVLNRDLQDIHAGFVHFVHAGALELFGRDFVSLRYPLAVLTVVQSCIVFAILRRTIGMMALCGGVAMSTMTFVQFLNPTANWYALFFTVVLIGLLSANAERTRLGLCAIGFLIVTVFLFRQLSGVFVAIGATAYLLLRDDLSGTGNRASSQGLAISMALSLAAYLWLKIDPAGMIIFGLAPMMILLAASVWTRVDNATVARIGLTMLGGAILAFSPLFAYHMMHHSVLVWWSDTMVASLSLTELPFFRSWNYANFLLYTVAEFSRSGNVAAAANGLSWLFMLLAPLILGLGVLYKLIRDRAEPQPLSFMAVFYALVSAHYAIPVYVFYSTGLTVAAMLSVWTSKPVRLLTSFATAALVTIALVFQAGQPLSRDLAEVVTGATAPLDADGMPLVSLQIEQEQRDRYAELLNFIESNSQENEPILALPMSPELYFLAARRPPVRFAIAPLALRTPAQLEEALTRLESRMPSVIVYEPESKYTTTAVTELIDLLKPSYSLCRRIGAFELYARGDCRD